MERRTVGDTRPADNLFQKLQIIVATMTMDPAYAALVKRMSEAFATTPETMAGKLFWVALPLYVSSTAREREQWATFYAAGLPEDVKIEVLRQAGAEDEGFALLRTVRLAPLHPARRRIAFWARLLLAPALCDFGNGALSMDMWIAPCKCKATRRSAGACWHAP